MRKILGILGVLGILGIFRGFGLVYAQEYGEFGLASRFGPHLACSNSGEFIREVRNRYGESGWGGEDWVPATIMFKVTDPADYIGAGLTAMTEDSGAPKLWPIIRLDGDPHGNRISEEEIEEFIRSLGSLGNLGSLRLPAAPAEREVIYIEFANEPNHTSEWGGSIDPGDYSEKLKIFVREIATLRQAQGLKFSTLNGALDQRAGDTDKTMEAVRFWQEGGLVSLVEDLDGYAFNNYHFEASGRYSKEGWKVMRGLFGMSTQKPVFLLEFGKDPNLGTVERYGFIADQYQLDRNGANSATAGIAAITPLLCVDGGCKRIDTAIFSKDGSVDWIISDGKGSCSVKEEVVGCSGKVGDRAEKSATEDTECWRDVLRPHQIEFDSAGERTQRESQFQTQGVFEDLCGIVGRIPLIGATLERILCRWAEVGQDARTENLPQSILEQSSRGQARSLGILDLRRLVARKVSEPQEGVLQKFFPAGIAPLEGEDPLYVHNKVAGCGEGRGSLLVPYQLCEEYGEGIRRGLPLPPEERPDPTPMPGEAGILDWTANIKEARTISAEVRADIVERVRRYWPDSPIDTVTEACGNKKCWDYVYERAQSAGWNPAFVIALWIEESGASGVHAWDVGCTGAPQNNLPRGLDCLFGLSYTDKPFEEFMCKFSEGHYPCEFSINPNFPRNLHHWYCRVAPEDEGACG